MGCFSSGRDWSDGGLLMNCLVGYELDECLLHVF